MALLLQSETDFGLGLLRQQNLTESLVFSPLSIALALSLVHVAAKGETRDQIREALVKGATDEQLEQHFANISAALLGAEKGTQVNIANHVFSRTGFPIKQSYLDTVKKLYNAGASSLNFQDAEASAEAINKFVRENTGEHIKTIINADSISDDLVAVLTNALYFKADWQNKFKKESTFKREFFSSADSKREIDFLHASAVNRNYAENDQFQVLSLPYKDETFALTIFLPKTRFGLSDALKNLDSASIQHLMSNVSNELVNVRIPKWKIETGLGLNEALQAIGIKKAFDQSADLGNFADGVYVSKVTHKAMIEVDEDGTKAAAATTVSISLKSAMFPVEEPKDFIADHPFLFVLSQNNHPLFIGLHH
ncbi:CRE-SRP-7 protein [Caenorhabditis remanei]|uniref:CRE-SRP-7 protein n=1 Tax=Caenorhabditis remanei TaxID=31234 RepID=E3LZK6_CAERE|nr:CRE-SRP-7 protein [Caenorhabditis remanei]